MPKSKTMRGHRPTARWTAPTAALLVTLLLVAWSIAGCGQPAGQGVAAPPAPAQGQAIPTTLPPSAQPPTVTSAPPSPQPLNPTSPLPRVTEYGPDQATRAQVATGATIEPPSAEEIAQSPHLVLSATEYDFGEVPTTGVLEHVFVITNTGKTDLIIDKLTST